MVIEVIVRALFLVGAIYWCRAVYRRRRHDIRRLKESADNTEKGVIVFIWLITAAIGLWLISFAWWILRRIFAGVMPPPG